MTLEKLSLLIESLKFRFFSLFGLAELSAYLVFAPAFWWFRITGNEAGAKRLAFYLTKRWSRRILSRLKCRIEIDGVENIPMGGPLVIMSNHQSLFDIPILMWSVPRLVGFVAKSELFRIPVFAFWMRQIRSIPLDRGDPATAGRHLQKMSLRLKKEQTALVVFPEGTRTKHPDRHIGRFRDGSARLAINQNIPILPVSIEGSRLLTDPEQMIRTRRGGRLVRVRIAPVVTWEVKSAKDRQRLMAEVRRIIVENFEAIRLQWPAVAENQPTASRAAEAEG